MKLSNKQIIDSQAGLSKLVNANLPVKQAYTINKTVKSIKSQLKFLEERREELIKKYGSKQEDGTFSISSDASEDRDKFFADYEELMKLEEDIDVRQLTLDELERVELTANELETIDFLISA